MELGYGKGYLDVDIPKKNLLGVIEPKKIPSLENENAAICEALKKPVGCERLQEIIKPGDRVVIIVNDITSPCPSSKLLLPLVHELNGGGVPDKDIAVVFALGIHRKHSEREKKRLVGKDVYSRIRCIDHNIKDCKTISETNGGKPIEIFKEVTDADIIICTGNIEFHYFAGYSGGAKAILPGVSSRELIKHNHELMMSKDAYPGNIQSPVRKEIEEVGMIVGIDFILNVVLNTQKEIVGVFAGHFIDAHRAGTKIVDQMYKVPVKQSDIVIASPGGYPRDINLCQAHKTLENAKYAVKDGGSIILVASCLEGYGGNVFERWMKEANSPEDLINRFKSNFELEGHRAASIALLLEKVDLYLVSDMSSRRVENVFMIPKKSVFDALTDAFKKHGEDATIMVMPYGGSTLPYADPN